LSKGSSISARIKPVQISASAENNNNRHVDLEQLVLDVSVGLLSGVMRVLGAVSIATLLFPAQMSVHFATGVSIAVVTVIAANLVGGLRNRIPFVTYSTDYPPIFLFSAVGAKLFSDLPEDQFVPTLIAFVMLGSITTGVVFLLVGKFRISNLVRFVPFPVISGFMGGIGLLIVVQSLGNLAGIDLSLKTVATFLSLNAVLHWIPGVVFALIMMYGGRVVRTIFFPQIAMATAIGIFLLALVLTGTDIHQAFVAGWSAKPVEGNLSFQFFILSAWRPETLLVLLPHIKILLVIVGLSLLSILITLSGIEVSTRHDMDFDKELQDAGIANVASGLLGGAISYQSVSTSMMNYKMGGRSRLVPILTGLVALVFLAFGWGEAALQYLPIALLSGLVLYIGVDFVKSWLIDSRRQMTPVEYLLVIAISIAIVIWGVIPGVTLGILTAILLFAVNYSKLRCIELRQTGKSLRSRVERPAAHEEILRRFDDHLRLFRMRGYLFFGTAHTVAETVSAEMKNRKVDAPVPLDVILDFQAVSGIDSSATLAFAKIFATANALGVGVVLINVKREIDQVFGRSIGALRNVRIYLNEDDALEAREEHILNTIQADGSKKHTAAQTLQQFSLSEDDARALIGFFEARDVAKGEVLFTEGDRANSMIIVDAGEFEIFREVRDGKTIRLRKVVAGAILGEMGIYLGGRRTANVQAIEESRVLVIDDTGLVRMHETAPGLTLKFNRLVIGVLAARLAHSNSEVLELSGAAS
jgi:SulP family sulfate permease